MIDYEEELKKFQPITELEDAEDEIYQRDLTDVMDVIQQMIESSEE